MHFIFGSHMEFPIAVLILLAYLIGAVPSSVWFGKIFYRKDVRAEGSGNAGATNTFRVLGAKAGLIVLVMDISKGFAAVMLSCFFSSSITGEQLLYGKLGLGATAALGHIFPVYLKFKGGKGVATFLGAVLAIFPLAAAVSVVAFLVVFFLTRFVSLGSLAASLVFMISVLFLHEQSPGWPVIFFAVAAPAIIFYTHRKNIARLVAGTESKISFTKKSE
jgi:glycerol-3-phosphate acyltransferase PlsY